MCFVDLFLNVRYKVYFIDMNPAGGDNYRNLWKYLIMGFDNFWRKKSFFILDDPYSGTVACYLVMIWEESLLLESFLKVTALTYSNGISGDCHLFSLLLSFSLLSLQHVFKDESKTGSLLFRENEVLCIQAFFIGKWISSGAW